MSDFSMIKKTAGDFRLSAAGEGVVGRYSFENGEVLVEGKCVGRFSCEPIQKTALDKNLFDFSEGSGVSPIPAVSVVQGEIMEAIQEPKNAGAYFVLPSQLNGAEYPGPTTVVRQIQEYTRDNTGGPRGQLAVHPAPGQFVLDNAETTTRSGINAIDRVLDEAGAHGFRLENGYLTMPELRGGTAKRPLDDFRSMLHTLRPLIMSDIPACGLRPSKREMSRADHTVSLVYASAVPFDSYQNRAQSPEARVLHLETASSVLVAQYYGAMAQIAARHSPSSPAVVYLMPLGGGVFNNPFERIIKAICLAVERLDKEGQLRSLDIRVLAWKGNPREGILVTKLLRHFKKFKAEGSSEIEEPDDDGLF